MSRPPGADKRQREMVRTQRKKQKEERLRRNRELRAQGIDPGANEDPDLADLAEVAPLPEVKLEDVVIGVAPQPRRASFGPTKLFVGGLSLNTTTEQLRAAFQQYGAIADVAVIPDRATGRSRGFGFVSFVNREDAMEAIKKMNGVELDGQSLKVSRAEER